MIHKTKFLAGLFSLVAVLFLNSCSEETETIDPCVLSPCNGSSFQVDFGGETYVATQTAAEFTEEGIIISGSKGNGESFEISIAGFTAGTYSSDKVNMSYIENIAAEFDYINQTEGDVKNGSVTITGIDVANKTITGTFSFTGYYSDTVGAPREPIVFSNGTFTIPYTGTNPNPNPVAGFFKADFNSQTFNATATQAIVAGGTILINAAKSNGESFQFVIDGTAAGSYNSDAILLSYSPSATSEFSYANFDESLNANGSVIITEVNTANMTISGTFQFIGHWSDSDTPLAPITFTNGSFTVPYTGNTSADTFFANVNGVEFEDDLIATTVGSSGGVDIISINALDIDQNAITLSFRDDLTIGQTYQISIATDPTFHAGYELNEVAQTITQGSIKITSMTATRVVGIFQIEASDPDTGAIYSITEGAFDVEY